MATWVFEARDHNGKPVKGTREAPDRQSALDLLRNEGLFLTRLEASSSRRAPARKTPPAPPPRETGSGPVTSAAATAPPAAARAPHAAAPPKLGGAYVPSGMAADSAPSMKGAAPPIPTRPTLRASSKNLSIFFSQIAAMLHAGTSLGQALNVMGKNAPSPALQTVSREMAQRVQNGEPLTSCMNSYPGLFTPLHKGMLMAGERGGFLERIFQRLSDYSERDYQLQQTVKRETWYPKAVLFCSVFIPALPNLFLSGFGAFFSAVAIPYLIIAIIILTFKGIQYTSPLLLSQSGIQGIFDGLKLAIPGVSKVTRSLATAKFARALGALFEAGVGPGESVKLASGACGNEVIARSCRSIIPRLEHGVGLTEALVSTRHFPPIVEQMLAIGEQSGMMDEQLNKAADFLETDAETAIKQSAITLGIVAFLAVALVVLMKIVGFYTGYFNDIMSMGESAGG